MRKAVLAILSVLVLGISPCASAQNPVAEAARKAREKKQEPAKAKKVYTNDDVASTRGKVSVVGQTAAPKEGEEKAGEKKEGEETKGGKDEALWRGRFSEARAALRQAEKELDLLQREFNLLERQYYSDPNQALREQLERRDINEQRRKIEAKQKEIEDRKRALTDLEEELRRSGGPPAWARES